MAVLVDEPAEQNAADGVVRLEPEASAVRVVWVECDADIIDIRAPDRGMQTVDEVSWAGARHCMRSLLADVGRSWLPGREHTSD